MAEPPDQGPAAAGRGDLRASHADREQVIGLLKAAFVEGMLAKDEFDLRVGQALGSRTDAELAVLTADLPAGRAAASAARPGAHGGNGALRRRVAGGIRLARQRAGSRSPRGASPHGRTALVIPRSRTRFSETPPGIRSARTRFTETTPIHVSHWIWFYAGQGAAAGPDSLRRDTTPQPQSILNRR